MASLFQGLQNSSGAGKLKGKEDEEEDDDGMLTPARNLAFAMPHFCISYVAVDS